MANPQAEDGHVDIANEIVEALAVTYLSSYESQVLWAIFRKTYGWHKKEDWITGSQLVEMTGIAKGHISRTLKKLIERNMVNKNGKKLSFQKDYDKWVRLPIRVTNIKLPKQDIKLPKRVTEVTQIGQEVTQIGKHKRNYTKETSSKETIQKKILSQTSFDKFDKVYQLTIYLEGKIMENNKAVNKRNESQIQSWCKDMDKLIRIDKAKPEEIKKIIDWVVKDKFWAKNVLCAESLRKQYPRFWKEALNETKSIKQIAEEDPFDWGKAIGEGEDTND